MYLAVLERLRSEAPGLRLDPTTRLLPLDRAGGYPSVAIGTYAAQADPDPRQGLTRLRQEVTLSLGVVLAAAVPLAATDRDPLEEALAELRAALLGYQHADWVAPLTLVQGQVLEWGSQAVLWQDVYSTRVVLSATIVS